MGRALLSPFPYIAKRCSPKMKTNQEFWNHGKLHNLTFKITFYTFDFKKLKRFDACALVSLP